ncbi:MAG: hypothetical protein DMC62_08760 [Verrucomicrobia bacterium]|nr:MAG: hypothetical protein DMC62_08760 [Verrucomicrobiota bacterium]
MKNRWADLFLGRAVMISPDGFDRRQRKKQRLFFWVRDLDGCYDSKGQGVGFTAKLPVKPADY